MRPPAMLSLSLSLSLLLLSLSAASALDVLVPPAGREKCVTEQLDPDTLATIKARVSSSGPGGLPDVNINRPGGPRDFAARMGALDAGVQAGGQAVIAMQVKDQRTGGIMFDSRAIPAGWSREFAVASIATRSHEMKAMDPDDRDEEFVICFTDVSPTRRPDPGTRVELKIEIQKSADPAQAAAVNNKLSATEQRLQETLNVARQLESEVFYAKQRESRHRDTSESTNARVAAYSWLSFAVLAGLGITQMLYLRRFFRSKHIVS